MDSQHSEKSSTLVTQIRTLQDGLARFNGLRIDATEYACLKALVLFKSGRYNFELLKNSAFDNEFMTNLPSCHLLPENVLTTHPGDFGMIFYSDVFDVHLTL